MYLYLKGIVNFNSSPFQKCDSQTILADQHFLIRNWVVVAYWGGGGGQISEFKTRLVYKVSSRKRATQRNSASKGQKMKKQKTFLIQQDNVSHNGK